MKNTDSYGRTSAGSAGMTLGAQLLRSHLTTHAMTQIKAAELLGCESGALSLYCSSLRCPPMRLKQKIEKLFGIPYSAWSQEVRS